MNNVINDQESQIEAQIIDAFQAFYTEHKNHQIYDHFRFNIFKYVLRDLFRSLCKTQVVEFLIVNVSFLSHDFQAKIFKLKNTVFYHIVSTVHFTLRHVSFIRTPWQLQKIKYR